MVIGIVIVFAAFVVAIVVTNTGSESSDASPAPSKVQSRDSPAPSSDSVPAKMADTGEKADTSAKDTAPAESAPTTQPATIALGATVIIQLMDICAPTWEARDQVQVAYSQGPEAFWNASVETHSFGIDSDTQGKVLDFKTGPRSGKAMVRIRILSEPPKPDTDDHIGEECWVSKQSM